MDLSTPHLKRKTAHVWRGGDTAKLSSFVPQSVGYRLYLHRPTKLYFLDTFRGLPPSQPFSGELPAVDLPLELPATLASITSVYAHLTKSGRAHNIKRSQMNFCRALSEEMQSPCLSFAVDDRTLDFACICEAGELRQMRTCCADLTLSFVDGKTRIEPWAPPGDEHPHAYLMMPSRRSLQAALPNVEVAVKIPTPENARHANALALWRMFTGDALPPIGLGEWDFSFPDAEFEVLNERLIQRGRQKRRVAPIDVSFNLDCAEIRLTQPDRLRGSSSVISIPHDDLPQLVQRLQEAAARLKAGSASFKPGQPAMQLTKRCNGPAPRQAV